ncbi:MAG: hypothetical protein PVH95_06520 [Anaerolineae bacterium]|jgi:hypothetical protein
MSSRQSDNLATIEFFTTTHRIVAQVQTASRPFCDLINDRSQSYLLVFNVRLSHLEKDARLEAIASAAYISKENLDFAIAPSREVRKPERGRYTSYEREVLVTLPRFELEGRFLGPQRADLWTYSPATLDPFFVLTAATARIAAAPDVTMSGDAILVNRDRIESICLGD